MFSRLRPLSRRRTALVGLGAGVSVVAAAVATRNQLHNDADPPPDDQKPSFGAGFTQDRDAWRDSVRYIGNQTPDGIIRMYWSTRWDTRLRIMSRGPRTLISLVEGDFVNRANVADVVQENVWINLESLFSWYQTDLSTPQPVEFIHAEPHPSPEAIHSVLRTAINFTDEFIRDYLLGRVFSTLTKRHAGDAMRAMTASTLVSALYEEDASLLHVASLGNMRAVLGRPRPPADDGSVVYDVHVLSVDHSPNNPAERERVQALHGDEPLFEDGTLLGRPYTRALGDSRLKCSLEVQQRLHRHYLGPPPDPRVKTPPYLSAEPDISSIKVESGDFLVLTTSFVPQALTDAEVVGLLGAWTQAHGDTLYSTLTEKFPDPPKGLLEPGELPVKAREKEDRTVFFRRWGATKEFVNTQPNPAVHIADNAMGGADEHLRHALLDMPPPESEGNTLPMGVVVVFFK
uniref:PPM-type phosphatase domain-containing protein n=1 Tax=Mycena chlorophos TaxID=658473 RepID=A0ABQ0KXS5_MYCCL|nr:predicted protein [Mycena chlorophos]